MCVIINLWWYFIILHFHNVIMSLKSWVFYKVALLTLTLYACLIIPLCCQGPCLLPVNYSFQCQANQKARHCSWCVSWCAFTHFELYCVLIFDNTIVWGTSVTMMLIGQSYGGESMHLVQNPRGSSKDSCPASGRGSKTPQEPCGPLDGERCLCKSENKFSTWLGWAMAPWGFIVPAKVIRESNCVL